MRHEAVASDRPEEGAADQAPVPAADPQSAAVGAVASGTRAAGIVFAAGYLSGYVDGPVAVVVGGLALITFGRSLLLERRAAAIAALSLAVVAAGLGIGALRWSTLDLGELRGVQAVLGPTVLVAPERLAWGASLAAGASFMALALWTALGPRMDRVDILWLAAEALIGSLAITTAFFAPVRLLGPEAASRATEIGVWAATAAVATLVVTLTGALLARLPGWIRSSTAFVVALTALSGAVLTIVSL